MEKRERELTDIRPSRRQMKLQQMEFYAFFHFTVNTYTDREWGDGTESPHIFNPEKLDAAQWARAVKRAGMKGAILTCKHHDGFCLWPSRYTEHSVANSPFREGKGDVVREVSQALRREGLAFGIYLSPWDRNNPSYGQGKAYDDYFVNQLTELLTQYGPVFAVWFDGACGEGQNGKVQYYDWERYYRTVRKYQPDACISVCGPDIRWCGNEAGDVRPSEWSVVPERLTKAERVQEKSQKEDKAEFREQKLSSMELDLGSREVLEGETELVWYPAEVNTSIRPGWFYHASEDDKVRSLDELLKIYYGSVGGNATFLLNIPPTPEGRIHPADEARLAELGAFLEEAFACNVIEKAKLSASECMEGHEIENICTDDYESYYQAPDGVKHVEVKVEFPKEQTIRHVVLKENILLSQRVERFELLGETDGCEKVLYEGTVIGYKRIVPFPETVRVKTLKIRFLEARVAPTLAFVGIYE